jgi:ABC-type transport system involved in multi-copper enzyme maturation permease subunit
MGGWSYVWAGLFGAFYVWQKGFGRLFLKAFAFNLLYGVVFAGFFVGTLTFIRNGLQWYGLQVVVIPIFILGQGTTMLRMIRDGYRRRGWMIRPG